MKIREAIYYWIYLQFYGFRFRSGIIIKSHHWPHSARGTAPPWACSSRHASPRANLNIVVFISHGLSSLCQERDALFDCMAPQTNTQKLKSEGFDFEKTMVMRNWWFDYSFCFAMCMSMKSIPPTPEGSRRVLHTLDLLCWLGLARVHNWFESGNDFIYWL